MLTSFKSESLKQRVSYELYEFCMNFSYITRAICLVHLTALDSDHPKNIGDWYKI
jgi:hypothetical protein